MTILNCGFVAAAGSGKSTCTDHLVAAHGYRNHALAGPLKVTIAFDVARQFRLDVLERPYYHWYDHVDRIIHGEMGVYSHTEIAHAIAALIPKPDPLLMSNVFMESGVMVGFDVDRHAEDVAVRDALLAIERRYKPYLRGVEQFYGTEVVRRIAEELRPGTWLTPQEEWTTILAKEFRRDNRAGIAACSDDVRHLHEATTIAETLDQPGILIRIERDDPQAIGMTAERAAHSSEQEWMKIPTHYRVVNNGSIENLHQAIDAALDDAEAHISQWGVAPARALSWSEQLPTAAALFAATLPGGIAA